MAFFDFDSPNLSFKGFYLLSCLVHKVCFFFFHLFAYLGGLATLNELLLFRNTSYTLMCSFSHFAYAVTYGWK